MTDKTNPGNYFEDFRIGQVLDHATPRTITEGDVSLYTALYGSRFALQSADSFAMDCGLDAAPVDDLLVFHIVFGKTVPDVSLNAVANLGYADVQFKSPVFPGDTVQTSSEVIGLKENSNGKTGVVYVRSTGTNQMGVVVLDYVRWVMVRKRDEAAPAPKAVIPDLPGRVDPASLSLPDGLDFSGYNPVLAGSSHFFEDYAVGEKIDHVDGMTIEEAEHMMATRLYQNTAKVHFNQHQMQNDRFGRRLIYGGHIISLARALSFNGLGNTQFVAAINGGSHTAPTFAGDTIYAWSEILETADLPGNPDAGALRVRTLATKDASCENFPDKDEDGKRSPAVVLDLDYWVILPKKP
jgi:2-methylfumaryl-CoA hydratase